jgi:hypothetical protein
MEWLGDDDRFIFEAVATKVAHAVISDERDLQDTISDIKAAVEYRDDNAIMVYLEYFMSKAKGVPFMACSMLHQKFWRKEQGFLGGVL